MWTHSYYYYYFQFTSIQCTAVLSLLIFYRTSVLSCGAAQYQKYMSGCTLSPSGTFHPSVSAAVMLNSRILQFNWTGEGRARVHQWRELVWWPGRVMVGHLRRH